VLALLLGKGADVNGVITKGPRQGTTALMLAAADNHAGAVTELLRHKAEVNSSDARGHTALRMAAAGGSLPIMEAVRSGRQEVVRLLLERGASPHATPRAWKCCSKRALMPGPGRRAAPRR